MTDPVRVEVGKRYTLDMEAYSAWYLDNFKQATAFDVSDVFLVTGRLSPYLVNEDTVTVLVTGKPFPRKIPTRFLIPVEAGNGEPA